MKTMVQIFGGLGILFFVSTGMMFSASAKLSDEIHMKERIKNSGWMGVLIQDVTTKTARKAKLDIEEGAYVKEVVKSGPADSAGIQEGDILVEFNGKKIFDSDGLVKTVTRTSPGTKVPVVLLREGQKKTIQLVVRKKKELKQQQFGVMPNIPNIQVFVGNHILGLRLLTLNEQLGEYFGAPNNEGVLVEEVEHASAAEKAGLKAGDIIIRVGKKTITAVEKIQRELQKYDEGDNVDFEVMRKGVKKTFALEMEEEQVVPQNFFFRKPHIRRFQVNPLDDAGLDMEIEEQHQRNTL